jgi:hypothetical protein
MECILMQEWITLRGASSGVSSITQNDECWLDLSPYTDIVAWIGVRDVTIPGTGFSVYLDIQTATVRDELYFLSMIGSPGQSLATNGGGPPTVINLARDFAVVPLSRWLRWKLSISDASPTAAWDATFCVWIAANYQSGNARQGASSGRGRMPFGRGGANPGMAQRQNAAPSGSQTSSRLLFPLISPTRGPNSR